LAITYLSKLYAKHSKSDFQNGMSLTFVGYVFLLGSLVFYMTLYVFGDAMLQMQKSDFEGLAVTAFDKTSMSYQLV
jgi:hypothetical protein